MVYTLVGNVEQPDMSEISRHRSLRTAGLAYQVGWRGNLCRVLDNAGRDVTQAALDAANGF